MKKVLIVVDYQRDFASPDGALYVPGAELIARSIQQEINDPSYDDIIYTMDTHISEDYAVSEEAEMFPEHCIFNTPGWGLFNIQPREKLINKLTSGLGFETPTDFAFGNEFVFVKDQFSIWDGNSNYSKFIESRYDEDTEFFIVGVAFDFCVRFNATGYNERGFKNISVIVDGTKGIAQDSYDEAVEAMEQNNVTFIGGV